MLRTVTGLLLLCTLLLTAACESSEERAEKHFQDGKALLEAGDVDRALVEFRNVFQLDGTHKEARRLYAQAEIDRGNTRAGYSQYLRLIEQYPDDIPARRELTRLALDLGDWAEVAKHVPYLIKAEPDDVIGQVADLSLRYRDAVQAQDEAAQASIASEARALAERAPQQSVLPELLADHAVRVGKREEALEQLSKAIELREDPRRLYMMRLGLLQEMGDLDAVESDLRKVIELYPDDATLQATLVRWYLSQDRLDDAEAYLRRRTEAAGAGTAEATDLVRFIVEFRGREEAINELDRFLEAQPENGSVYRSIRAGLMFETGRREEAIAELQSIIDASTEETDEVRTVKVALAQMLEQTGNSVGARALVEDVLTTDSNNVLALKMRARWLIEDDEPEDAILALRTALEQSPRDPALMTLMAQAYERAGNRALMAEMLSLAVEVSNNAPDETVRYARYLLSEGKLDAAESALMDSLQLTPGNVDLLNLLGSTYVQQSDWARAGQVADTLAKLDAPGATAGANALRAEILARQGRNEEVVGFLEQLLDSGEAGAGARVAIVRTYLQQGQTDDALKYLDDALAESPDDPTLRFLKAAVLEAKGESDQAETMFQALVEQSPDLVLVWRALYLLQQRSGAQDDAAETLQSALEANPDSPDLLWMKASQLQQEGDLEGALQVYKAMYDQNSSVPLIANNYASLLTMLRDDEASVEEAYAVARRLKGLEVPAFQDTYGWIAYLKGDYDAAVQHLEPAAAALTEDPSVQYHAGLAFAAADRVEDAKSALQRALDLAEAGRALPQADAARQKLAELKAGGE